MILRNQIRSVLTSSCILYALLSKIDCFLNTNVEIDDCYYRIDHMISCKIAELPIEAFHQIIHPNGESKFAMNWFPFRKVHIIKHGCHQNMSAQSIFYQRERFALMSIDSNWYGMG